jgi:single-strand DNA-binding protein
MKNHVTLIGHLGQDPEFKNLDNCKKVVHFTLATSEYYKDSEGSKISETTWHNIVAWNKLAETAIMNLKKGDLLYLEGKIAYRSYEDRNNVTKYITEIVVDELILLPNKK